MTINNLQYIIAGNWKMFKTVDESTAFLKGLGELLPTLDQNKKDAVEILVFPPATSLFPMKEARENTAPSVRLGVQNMHYEENGAFTGEISPLMLENIVEYILIGHSERRNIFKETDLDVNKKIKTALRFGFKPMVCIGESLEEREAGKTMDRIKEQLDNGLDGLTGEEIEKIAIAYEPIWAIGTGKTATPEQAQEVHAFIREKLQEKISNPESFKILYGGSVKPGNSCDILAQKDINGVLIGGASLKIDDFFAIIQNSFKLIETA